MTVTDRPTLKLQMEVTFRYAIPSDLPKLEWYGQYTHFRRVFQKTYEEQEAGYRLMLLAVTNNWPIGQMFIQLANFDDPFVDMRRRGYFYSFRVMDAFQGRGLGSALLEEAIRVLAERRYDTVSIAAAKDNPGAKRLYERHGFRVVAEDPGRWHYVDHEGRTHYVSEPCYILEREVS
jgi:ribosomal protein S18 acetylase RimI-like enzyme